jgi:alpha-L-rhamnosidase
MTTSRPARVWAEVTGGDALGRGRQFSCSDDRVSRLHEAAVWLLRSNICDIPTDCPQRERAGWTGDWQIFAPTAAYLYDVLAFTRKWLGDVALDQRADGCVANISPCSPAEGFDGSFGPLHGSAGWGDAVVSVPWDLYEAYGDASLLREMWDVMTAWAGFAAGAAAGGRHPDRAAARPVPLTHERYLWDTGFHWGEWLEPGGAPADFGAFVQADKSEVATAYLYRSAATLVRIAGVLGLPEDAWVRYRDIAAGALEAWRREFVREDGTLAVQTQASHVRALAFGLVPSESRPAVASRLAGLVAEAGGHLATGFLSTSYLLPVAGLRPVGAGYRTFEVRPRPGGGITSARACHISPFGPIEVGGGCGARLWSWTCWCRRELRPAWSCRERRRATRIPATTTGAEGAGQDGSDSRGCGDPRRPRDRAARRS